MNDYEAKYFASLLTDFYNQSDRAKVIIIAAELDQILLNILEKHFVYRSKISQNDSNLFSKEGPLGAFGTRIELAYRLGIIDKIVCNDLQIIRRIRNEFAHKTHGFSFNVQKIKDLVANLKIPKVYIDNKKVCDADLKNAGKALISISFFLHGHLTSIEKEVKRVDEKFPLDNYKNYS